MPHVVALMGPGGQARVTLDAALAAGIEVTGLLDDSGRADYFGIPVLGPVVDWRKQHGALFIVGMSDARQRVRLGEAIPEAGGEVLQVIHPTAWVSPFAHLGRGTKDVPEGETWAGNPARSLGSAGAAIGGRG